MLEIDENSVAGGPSWAEKWISGLLANPGVFEEIRIRNQGKELGGFHSAVLSDEKGLFIQIENLNPPEFGEIFIAAQDPKGLETLPGGIFRIRLNLFQRSSPFGY